MREYSSAVEAYIADIGSMVARHLVWIEARNRDTDEIEATGFWNGSDVRVFEIDGVERTYYGAGALLGIEPIQASVGLEVRMQQLSLSSVPPEVVQMIYGYDVRLAPVEVHRALFDPETNTLVAEPHRVLKGTVDTMPVPRPEAGGTAAVTISVASAARAMTRALTVKKSDAAQRAISATDRGREYAAVSGTVSVFWGKVKAIAKPPPAAPITADREWNQR